MRNERSGVPRPDHSSPCSNSLGGKFCGRRMTRTRSPCWPSTSQKVCPWRGLRATGRFSGSHLAAAMPAPTPSAAPTRTPAATAQRGRTRKSLSTPNEDQEQQQAEGEADHRRRALAPQERLVLLEHEGQLRLVVADVAGQEVEDAVPPGVEAGGEGRPGDRRLRGDRRAQRREGALGAQAGEVGELPLVHPPLGELGVGAVEAEDHRLRRLLGGERCGGGEGDERSEQEEG